MQIAVIIPAFNEDKTIAKVIEDFYKELPEAFFCIVNNNSSDMTEKSAQEALNKTGSPGKILFEKRQGKANALRRAFQEIDSDICIVVDGDATYSALEINKLLQPVINNQADMIVGDRLSSGVYKNQNKRAFHNFGNQLVKNLINFIFKSSLNDIMSGYRVLNRKFVHNFPILKQGFEIETEMTLHALDKRFRILEIPINYFERPQGSKSKLNTFSDGYHIVKTVLQLFKDYKPMQFFLFLCLFCVILGLIMGIPVIIEYIKFKYVYKIPSAILSTGLMILGMFFFSTGLVLDTVVKIHKFDYELKLNLFGRKNN